MTLNLKVKRLRKLRKNVIPLVLILFSTLLGLTGCPKDLPNPGQSNFHFYIVISPINKEQIQQARTFFINAKGKGVDKARIIVPGNRYTIAKFCEKDTPDFPNSGTWMQDDNNLQMQAVTGGIEKALIEIAAKNPNPCNASAASLVELASYLNDAASRQSEQMIVLIQAPWERSEVDRVFPQIKESMDKLAKSNKVEKIIIFGVNQNAAVKVTQAFQSFNANGSNRIQPAASDIPQLITKLQGIRSNVLKFKN